MAPAMEMTEDIEIGEKDFANLSTDETKYVDPRNYHSPYEALTSLRVDEIPPREIKLLESIGTGLYITFVNYKA